MKSLKGFTLAEGLITLTICGIVAVVALPGLMAGRDSIEHQAHLHKAYTELNDFASYFQADHGDPVPKWILVNGRDAFFKEYANYMASITKTSDWQFGSSVAHNYKYYFLNNPNSSVGTPCDASGFREDIAGRTISFDDSPLEGYNGPRICVDTNGQKGPNTYGIDVFSFMFTVDGEVIPEGQEHPKNYYGGKGIHWSAGTLKGTENCYNQNGANYGVTCAYYAINDSSPKDSSKTYWKYFIGRQQYQK